MTTEQRTLWTASDLTEQKYLGPIEFEDDGEWHSFEVIETPSRLVFGGACNVGFLESGYIERDEYETLTDCLCELLEELQTYYNCGPEYCNRIVFNERM